MYAVVTTGGKQAKVETGSLLVVEKLDAEVGATVTLPVLTIADDDRLLVSAADLASASVTAEVVEHFLGDKQIVFKFQKRKGYKRTKGHRQMLTSIRITDIAVEGGAKPAKAKAEAKTETPKKEKAPKAAPVDAPVEKAAAPAETATDAQCAAIKSDGTRCANKAKDGSQYCGVHAKKYEG